MGGTAPVTSDVLEDIGSYLAGSDRVAAIEATPVDTPNSLVCAFEMTYYPPGVELVSLELVWYQNNDFSIHYREVYTDGTTWECRWDRHPNSHNAREHFHPGPDAGRARDESYPTDWRDVLTRVLTETDERMRAFWNS